ncbi:hypothetical protein TSOC_013619 [Tetrabaena socialis]|uniref:Uncharacterized protein n=1 Tax=Tetrabaena socialis TaxID=47790 RepID=A0A2J7ZJW6_9CHLO|nr:hypothetical protein TSOC_013619 [Tetrabaena socialis]|eukprot:PNH00553.1 hypothetical protein TSOC_013619 [Tetrabaena socialis]
MSGVVTRGVGAAIPALFGAQRDSDCDVLFCLERRKAGEGAEGGEPSDGWETQRKRRQRQPETALSWAAAVRAEPPAGALVGEPLPGHILVLRLASERFRAQIERWDGGAGEAAVQGAEASPSSAAPRPQLRVPLGSEAEVPSARAALGYAYTGVVAADGVRAALEVRRQAAYLQIDGCTAACDELLVEMLAAGHSSRGGRCGGHEPTFAPILAAAKEALVRHFGDVLAALNTPSLRQQLLQLPAAGVEALLASKAFGTDSEDSVLLLLATWMKANHGQTDAATRERLCRLVRLVQLGRPYLTAVLPALAADHEHCGAAGTEKDQLLSFGGQLYDTKSPCYSTAARPQCLPWAGRTFEWAISQQELLAALGELQSKGRVSVHGSFVGGSRLLCARGLEWKLFLLVKYQATSADICMDCDLPAAYDVVGSRLGSSSKAVTIVGLEAHLVVHGWSRAARQDAYGYTFRAAPAHFGLGRVLTQTGARCPTALPLAQQQQAGRGGGVLKGWAAYLHDRRLTGTLTLLPAP